MQLLRRCENRRCSSIMVLCLTLCLACLSAERSIFEPNEPIAPRLLPLRIHIIDPNISSIDDPSPLVPEERTLEARYLIKKDFGRNVFMTNEPEYGRLIVRIERKVSGNLGWLVASTFTLFAPALFGVPIYSQSTSVRVQAEIQNAQNQLVSQYAAEGEDTQYMALYWGRGLSIRPREGSQALAGAQMLHAEALAAALSQIRDSIERDAASLNRKLREAGTL